MKKGLENLQDTINSINIAEAMPKGKKRLKKKKHSFSNVVVAAMSPIV